MTLANTTNTYGRVTKTFHWLTALLILTAIPLGIIANNLPLETGEQIARKAFMFSMHKTVGVTAFFVALARILWAFTQAKPAPLHPERRLEAFLAETVHWLLYGSLLLVPLAGWIHHSATTGYAPIWWPFGQNLPFVPKNETLAGFFSGLHIVLERVLAFSIVLHVAGALKHRFVDRDVTLARMLPGDPDVPELPKADRSVLPLATALVIWAAALGIGTTVGAFDHASHGATDVTLEDTAGEWIVEDGTLGLTITQFDNEVSGEFGTWTAEIFYEDGEAPGPAGSVFVTIAIPSLTMGSVTDQALGPDYFDADIYPLAEFEASLAREVDGHLATGQLFIKDAAVPVSFPFNLRIEGDRAEMDAQLTLDRRDFGIGDNMPDESSLAFAVDVAITLTATRATPAE